MEERDIFTPPQWSPPSTQSSVRTVELDGEVDWQRIADREREEWGDALVWIARRSASGSESGPVTYTYRIIRRVP